MRHTSKSIAGLSCVRTFITASVICYNNVDNDVAHFYHLIQVVLVIILCSLFRQLMHCCGILAIDRIAWNILGSYGFFLFSVVKLIFLSDCVACVCAQYRYIVVGGGFSG
ncbi:unnamed protein product [Meganyctiphanes norvegica]|uniref:Uncharacterized protein n=1 Tax=Meganyctiphanes norvegica TaxID=48144 RepID=A0AAV2RW84_MEGNR